jgi:hypothetical protein
MTKPPEVACAAERVRPLAADEPERELPDVVVLAGDLCSSSTCRKKR